MREYIQRSLSAHKIRTGEPYRLGLINRGGTVMCLTNRKGKLEPAKNIDEVISILSDGADFAPYFKENLLEMVVVRHDPIDSSQMRDEHREPDLEPAQNRYAEIDGIMEVHGTDTGPETARFMHLALPAYDPREYALTGAKTANWTKPHVIVAAQEPAAIKRSRKLVPFAGSDADVNLVLAMAILTDYRMGESSVLTNGREALRGTVARKHTESHVPAFTGDPGVAPLAERTAFGITYPNSSYFPRKEGKRVPYIIQGGAEFERKVLTVNHPAHLQLIKAYIDAKKSRLRESEGHIQQYLPDVILYGSKGAGNVQKDDYRVIDELRRIQDNGILVAKVPLLGGRVLC